ncbi:unnamed protein product [Dracunculus medinensis]|uniref:AGC-kinase C-terminal domain-containing protein n=1 Tax=Dracunculus medinensis TaxID=318479 RepID=A0A0N4UK11_DRAME|nr:unnamed protein product [Dracunculus medinensis]
MGTVLEARDPTDFIPKDIQLHKFTKMIGMINIPSDVVSEFYAEPERSSDRAVFRKFSANKCTVQPISTSNDNLVSQCQRQQSKSTDSLWHDTLQQSVLLKMAKETIKKSVSCDSLNSVTNPLDDHCELSNERCPQAANCGWCPVLVLISISNTYAKPGQAF